jgi:predicted GNAT family acetyltransferase
LLYQNDELDEMTYVSAGTSRCIIDHTGVEQSFSGRGVGKQLVMEAVKYAAI